MIAGYGAAGLATSLDFAADLLMSFPPLLLAIAFIAVRGPGLDAMIVVGIIFAPRLFRIGAQRRRR